MITFLLIFLFILIINCYNKYNFYNNNKNSIYKFNGIYTINSLLNNHYIAFKNNIIILTNKQINFRLVPIALYSYYIESRGKKKKLGITDNGKIIFYDKSNYNKNKVIWNIFEVNNNEYLIQNNYNQRFIEVDNDDKVKCSNYLSYNISDKGKSIEKQFVFTFVKLFEEGKFNSEFLNYINNEPIDIVIKYIDLTDKSLNRNGIKQTYKDQDNQEIKYCIRSILYNLPWIRKIYILMPNEKVNFFKSIEEINEKIIYVKDKDLLGFNSANIQAFIFNLFKMEKFGLSKNFIYMEDDYFIGKPLKKYDFFYYDNITKKILPYLVTTKFYKLNNTEVMEQYNSLFKIKDIIDPHSSPGFWLGIFITHKFFLENYKAIIISTEFSHNAIAENIDDLKEIFEEAKKYKFFNETLYSKQRYILNLNHQHFVNLYQLNIKYRKVHSIKSKYINIEKANKNKLNSPLFVINTNGNHIPLKRQLKIQKKILEKKFSIPIKYEKIDNKKNNLKNIYFIHLS